MKLVLENLTRAIVDLCRSGLPPTELWERVLPRVRRAVPFDAAFWSTVDPATLLFTQPQQQDIPASTIPYFVDNEFIDDDVNKWTTLARDRVGVRTLVEATAGVPDMSPRYRDIFRPLGLGDELRAVFRSGGMCWGYMCVHREAGAPFSREEVLFVQAIASHVGEAIRGDIVKSCGSRSDQAAVFPAFFDSSILISSLSRSGCLPSMNRTQARTSGISA